MTTGERLHHEYDHCREPLRQPLRLFVAQKLPPRLSTPSLQPHCFRRAFLRHFATSQPHDCHRASSFVSRPWDEHCGIYIHLATTPGLPRGVSALAPSRELLNCRVDRIGVLERSVGVQHLCLPLSKVVPLSSVHRLGQNVTSSGLVVFGKCCRCNQYL